jgi:hypothetical protein
MLVSKDVEVGVWPGLWKVQAGLYGSISGMLGEVLIVGWMLLLTRQGDGGRK